LKLEIRNSKSEIHTEENSKLEICLPAGRLKKRRHADFEVSYLRSEI